MPDSPSDSTSDISLSPEQAKFLFWFTGGSTLLKALTPLSTYLGDLRKYKHMEPAALALKLYDGVKSDIGRQTATCTFQLITYFVGGNIIKAVLKNKFPPKEDDPRATGRQEVTIQVSCMMLQVIATVLSRPFGAAQLIRLLDQKEKPSKQGVQTKLQGWVNDFINNHLRNPSTKTLLPGKMTAWGMGGMTVYLVMLMGVLYGFSSLLEKMFPNTYKPKSKAQKPNPSVTSMGQSMPPFYNSTPSFLKPQPAWPMAGAPPAFPMRPTLQSFPQAPFFTPFKPSFS